VLRKNAAHVFRMTDTMTRPNGRSYRPRNTKLKAVAWSNFNSGVGDDEGVLIVGTHDLDRATEFATRMCEYWFARPASLPQLDWVRDGYGSDGPQWVSDTVRGRPGIWFTAATE
jgi:hypothetical protein